MAISDRNVIAELTDGGTRVEDFFLIGLDICLNNSRGEPGSLLIENLPGEQEGEMHFAVVDFLRRHGVKEYSSYEEYYKSRDGTPPQ